MAHGAAGLVPPKIVGTNMPQVTDLAADLVAIEGVDMMYALTLSMANCTKWPSSATQMTFPSRPMTWYGPCHVATGRSQQKSIRLLGLTARSAAAGTRDASVSRTHSLAARLSNSFRARAWLVASIVARGELAAPWAPPG